MRIFLSYSSQDRPKAEAISLALAAEGHDVFFDRDDLKGGEDYNGVIRRRIADSDLFIFLISPDSIREGGYALTELRFARERWEHPGKRVLPVMLEPTDLNDVPAYLKSVTIFQPEGSDAAEVAAHVSRIRGLAGRRAWVALPAAIAVVAVIAYVVWRPAATESVEFDPGDFVTRYEYSQDVIERTEYALEAAFRTVPGADSLVRIITIRFGTLADTAAGMSIAIRLNNMTAAPMQLDIDRRFFSLVDDQNREAALLYFCCDSGRELLAPGAGRDMQLIFAAHRGWSGKEVQARRINFKVSGLLPLISATWSVPALATAADPP